MMKLQLLSACFTDFLLVIGVRSVTTISQGTWAGSVNYEKAAGWKEVTGTIVVPTPSAPSGTNGSASAFIWVGIDGAGKDPACNGQILQTGIKIVINNGVVSYQAWREWWPAAVAYWSTSDISFHAGDTVTMTVAASSSTSGTATVTNHNTGKTVSYPFVGDTHPLTGCEADWIVEDYKSNGQAVPFANFGTVTFSNAQATAANGSVYGPGGNPSSEIYQIVQNNKTLTSCSATTTTATCSYV